MPAGTATATKPRVRKSRSEKATEALAAAKVRHDKAVATTRAASDALQAANTELSRAASLLSYAQQHPDLPEDQRINVEPPLPEDVAVSDG